MAELTQIISQPQAAILESTKVNKSIFSWSWIVVKHI